MISNNCLLRSNYFYGHWSIMLALDKISLRKRLLLFLTFTDKKGVQSIRKINWANRFKVCKFCYISPWKNKNLRHAWDKVVVSKTFVLEKIQIVFSRKTILILFCVLFTSLKDKMRDNFLHYSAFRIPLNNFK